MPTIRNIACFLITIFLISTTTTQAQVPLFQSPFWQSSEEDVYTTGMIWRDADNDGYIDAFFSCGNDMELARNMFYHNNFGTLPNSASWLSGNNEFSGHCAVGDIDDNGYPDLVVANYLGPIGFSSTNQTNLYYNYNGNLTIMPGWYSADSFYSFSCALGDVDGDGDLDLALATGEGYTSTYDEDIVYLNNNGVFESTPGWQSAAATAALDVTWGDVDNDGDLDLAFCYDNSPAHVFYNNNGTLETTASWSASSADPSNTLIFGDVNGDGWLDLIIADNNQLGGEGYFRVYFNDGTGTLDTSPGWQSSDGGYGSGVSLYDYDNDGDMDLAAGRWWDKPRVYQNTGATFTTAPVWQANPLTVVEELAWIDIDGDGVEELADTIYSPLHKVYYTSHSPLQAIDSVKVDGTILANADFCYDLVSGWISLAAAPTGSIVIYYKYSFKCDLTSAHWDTYNMAFPNYNKPYVDFYASDTLGWAPLTVYFSDSSIAATAWNWDFGDGDTALSRFPTHEYREGGVYDVKLGVQLPDGPHNHTTQDMIIILADSILGGYAEGEYGDTVSLPVSIKNTQPLHTIHIPVQYGGTTMLAYRGYNLDGCRTEGIEHVGYINYDANNKRFTLEFYTSNGPAIPAGEGPVINLLFELVNPLTVDFSTAVIFNAYSSFEPEFSSKLMTYNPEVYLGIISQVENICCQGMTGNTNCSELEEPDISDIVRLIDYLYLTHDPLCCPEEADTDGNGAPQPDISDIVRLIDYLYLETHTPPAACPEI